MKSTPDFHKIWMAIFHNVLDVFVCLINNKFDHITIHSAGKSIPQFLKKIILKKSANSA